MHIGVEEIDVSAKLILENGIERSMECLGI